ncbi:hypothetical protein ASZ90_008530 [hydrocarbon metagenome]|uniref:Uncharacterized protein n=1 Tax=hydrocarbon metagenome TaxID=938273 RepID=A0A0W8FLF2_9ZZZZ
MKHPNPAKQGVSRFIDNNLKKIIEKTGNIFTLPVFLL